MMEFWIIPEERPSLAGAVWESLFEEFNTEVFSEEKGIARILTLNPDYTRQDAKQILLTLCYQDSLGRRKREP